MEALTWVANRATPLLSNAAICLDIGCGTGLLARSLGNSDVIGVDYSPPMLDLAKKHMSIVCRQDIRRLGLADGCAELIFVLFVLDDYPRPVKRSILRKVCALLRPGGGLFLAAYGLQDQRMGTRRASVSDDPSALRVHLEPLSFYTHELSECGLHIVAGERLVTSGAFTSPAGNIRLEREFIVVESRRAGSALSE